MGFFSKLKEGLTKTRDNSVSGIDSVFSGFSSIDDDFNDGSDKMESFIYYKEYINKLIDVHTKNIKFEINNPYIPPITKSKKSKRKIITYKTKDLITGEDTFLIQDIKTKKYKVNKNPNALDKPKKYTGRNLSEMYFDFTNKEEY